MDEHLQASNDIEIEPPFIVILYLPSNDQTMK